MANTIDIGDKIMSMGADRVEIVEDPKTDVLHIAVIRRPNPGKILRNIKTMIAKRVSKKTTVVVHINPCEGEECKNTHVLGAKPRQWRRVPLVPIEGLA